MLDPDADISMLRKNPGKLLVQYQPIIRIIVRNLAQKGYLPRREINDLIQDVNRKLVERLPRILERYNYRSRFKTYFSVVVRNLCLEEIRKVRLAAEPQADVYDQTAPGASSDMLVIRHEYERLLRALRLFGRERSEVWITLRNLAGLPVKDSDFLGLNPTPPAGESTVMAVMVNDAIPLQKREKMEVLAAAFNRTGRKPRTAEAQRKWVASRLDELVDLMNGKPPISAYTIDILFILIDRAENS